MLCAWFGAPELLTMAMNIYLASYNILTCIIPYIYFQMYSPIHIQPHTYTFTCIALYIYFHMYGPIHLLLHVDNSPKVPNFGRKKKHCQKSPQEACFNHVWVRERGGVFHGLSYIYIHMVPYIHIQSHTYAFACIAPYIYFHMYSPVHVLLHVLPHTYTFRCIAPCIYFYMYSPIHIFSHV